jgi:hypothetical protein
MRYLVPHYACQLSFIVHQTDQLARGINIAAWDSERIIDRAVKQRNREAVARISEGRLNCDILGYLFNVVRLRACHGPAKFG